MRFPIPIPITLAIHSTLRRIHSLQIHDIFSLQTKPNQTKPNVLFFSFLSSSSNNFTMSNTTDEATEPNYGFHRPEMYSVPLGNTIDFYERHVFLCYTNPDSWPPNVESEPLPMVFASALKSRKDDLPLKTRITVCGGCKAAECTDGDVLIFPEMVKYKGLKESDVDAFLDDALVNGKPWASGEPESLVGAYVFVCAHGSRDKRCGVCGPVLIEKFEKEIESRNLDDKVFVNSCSHIGGHKYAGNVIIFGTGAEGKIIGDWYGYVTPDDVPDLLDVHIGKGEIIEKLWRGQMGLKIELAEKVEEKKPATVDVQEKIEENLQATEEVPKKNTSSCCQGPQGINGVSCYRAAPETNGENGEVKTTEEDSKKNSVCLSGCFGKWDQSDVLVAAGVIGAVATIAVAYSIFRRSS